MRVHSIPFLLLLAATGSAQAQDSCVEIIEFPAVGRWAEYKAVYDNKLYTVRWSVVGSERRGGADLKWLELRMTGQNKDRNLIYQMLVPGTPAEMGNVEEIVFKAGDKQAMKMSGGMMKMIRDQMDKQSFLMELCKDVTLVGPESVTVPAGKFQTRHFRSTKYKTDSWMAPGVPFSLIKSVGENHRMELRAQGSGAKSSITEKPQEMPALVGPS
jgi:hypothetical protein